MLHTPDDHGGHDQSRQCRCPHVGQELRATQVEVTEDDEVGQVRTGQEQRPGIGQEQAAVEERRLASAPASSRVDEHRSQEGHRGIEIQDGRHDAHHDPGAHEEDDAVVGRPGQRVAGGGKEAVIVGHHAYEKQARDEDER